jgi:hypothetical protein
MAPFGKWKGPFQQQEKERSSSLFIPLVFFKNGKLIIIRSNLPTRDPPANAYVKDRGLENQASNGLILHSSPQRGAKRTQESRDAVTRLVHQANGLNLCLFY